MQTLNDIMVAIIAGGFDRYLVHIGDWQGRTSLLMRGVSIMNLRNYVSLHHLLCPMQQRLTISDEKLAHQGLGPSDMLEPPT